MAEDKFKLIDFKELVSSVPEENLFITMAKISLFRMAEERNYSQPQKRLNTLKNTGNNLQSEP
jgi:hypothetical protein